MKRPPHQDMTARQSPVGYVDIVVTGTAVALAGGFAEVLVQITRRYGLETFTWMSPDHPWMAPVATWLVALPVTMALLAARALVPRVATWALIAGAPTTMAVFSLLFLIVHRQLHLLAQLILAIGVGRLAGHVAATRPTATAALMRAGAAGLVTVLAVLVAAYTVGPAMRHRRPDASVPPANAQTPNVLLIVLDTVRAASLGLYGNSRPTSRNLDRWAQSGVAFDRAYAPAPWTLPSHASLFTGMWPHELSADWETPLDETSRTVAEQLAARGYVTGGFTGNLFYTSADSGLTRGFDHYEGYPRSFRQFRLSSGIGQFLQEQREGWNTAKWQNDREYAQEVTSKVLDWIDTVSPRPFFAFMNYYDAHEPYVVPAHWRDRFQSDNSLRDRYEASIAALDEHLGVLFTELQRRDALRHTVVIVTADHGESAGEHGLQSHGSSLYREVLEVPLVMWGPGIPTGQRIRQPVSLRDIPATIAEMTGGAADQFPGSPLSRLWQSGGSTSPVLARVTRPRIPDDMGPVRYGNMFALIDGSFHYIHRADGVEELYDLSVDPAEQNNVVARPEYLTILAGLRRQLGQIAAAR